MRVFLHQIQLPQRSQYVAGLASPQPLTPHLSSHWGAERVAEIPNRRRRVNNFSAPQDNTSLPGKELLPALCANTSVSLKVKQMSHVNLFDMELFHVGDLRRNTKSHCLTCQVEACGDACSMCEKTLMGFAAI